MAKPTYDFVPCHEKNFSRGRRKPVSAIVLHYTGATRLASTVQWFKNPRAIDSAHYLIGRDGDVVQMVRDEDVAFHAGRSALRPDLPDGDPLKEINVNSFSIGIELVGTHDSGFEEPQLRSLYAILEALVAKYRIPPERVVGHTHIAPGRKLDPDGYDSQFDWQRCRDVCRRTYRAVTGT